MTSLLTMTSNADNCNSNNNRDSNVTLSAIQNQHHIASMQNGPNKPHQLQQLQQLQQQQQKQQSYTSRRNNSFSLYKCPTNGGGSICGSIKSSSETGNEDTTSLCVSDNGGNGGCRPSSRGSVLRVRQYMLSNVRFVEELGVSLRKITFKPVFY